MKYDITIAQYNRSDDTYMDEMVRDNSDFLLYQYGDNRGSYKVNFNKHTGILSLTPNVAPKEALDSLEQAIQNTQHGDIKLILPPNNREFTFRDVTKLEYIGRTEIGPSNTGNY